MKETSPCPHPECDTMILPRLFCCRNHWFGLPFEIRREITLAWRGRVANETSLTAKAHREAKRKAFEFWNQGPRKEGA